MRRELNDPRIAEKLVRLIEGLMKGAAITRAARDASLDRDVAVRFLDSIRGQLAAVVPEKRPAAPSRPAKKNAAVGRLTAFSDGACRGNPGEASCAVILYDDSEEELLRQSKRLGVTTNNVAEYEGVLLALELAATLRTTELLMKLDSELVVRQLTGVYKVKHPSLKPLHGRATLLIRDFDRVEIVHIAREDNKIADKLANDELDGKT